MDSQYIFDLLADYMKRYPEVEGIGGEIINKSFDAREDAIHLVKAILDSLVP